MPFKNEEGDLQKLNITIQFVFLSLNFFYIDSLPFDIQTNFVFLSWCIQWYKKS
jgi:hypothetical protein